MEGPAVTIRPSRGGLILMVGWIGLLCLLTVLGAAGEHDRRGLFLVFVWLPWLIPLILAARMRLTAAGDVITYRSLFRTRSWHRGEIQGFDVSPGWSYRSLRIEMRTGAGERVPFAITVTRLRSTRIENWHAALENWLTASGETTS